jgi:hypothetical protein
MQGAEAEASGCITSTLDPSIPAKLLLKGKSLTMQEEATKDDDAVICSWLAILWDGDAVRYKLGEWCESIQEASSNYREIMNLVNDIM